MSATHPNPKYKANDLAVTTANPYAGNPTLYLQPTVNPPHVFFENALGAASLFERVEVWVNGYEVREERMGVHQYLYATMNKLLTTKAHRLKKYNYDVARISLASEQLLTATPRPDPLAESLKGLQSDAPTASADLIHRFDFPGVFPFDCNSNQMHALTGVTGTNGYLPPEVNLTIRLHKRKPLDALLQYPSQEDAVVYSETAATMTDNDKVTFNFKDLLIQYEVMSLDAARMAQMKKRCRYFVDVPHITLDMVEAGKMVTTNIVDLPRGCKFVALAWMYEDEVFFKSSGHKRLSPRFFFPPNAASVTVGFEDKPGLLFPLGFEELGTAKAEASITSREYFRLQQHAGLYGRSYEKLFPRHPARSRDGLLFFSLLGDKVEAGAKLHVKVKYEAAKGLQNYYLACISLVQEEFVISHGKPMSCTVLM